MYHQMLNKKTLKDRENEAGSRNGSSNGSFPSVVVDISTSALGKGLSAGSNSSSSSAASEQQWLSTLAAYREAIRHQAVQLATDKQAALTQESLSRKHLHSALTEQERLRRQAVGLQARLRHSRATGELRLAELEDTVRLLSSRGPMHTHLATARSEIQVARLEVVHMRTDLEALRELLTSEQRRTDQIRQERDFLQAQLDRVAVLQTVSEAPAVDPAILIEIFSGLIMEKRTAAAKECSGSSSSSSRINNNNNNINDNNSSSNNSNNSSSNIPTAKSTISASQKSTKPISASSSPTPTIVSHTAPLALPKTGKIGGFNRPFRQSVSR